MVESVHQFADWLQALPPVWIYATLLAIAYGENVIPPLPGDVALVIGGYLVGLGLIGFVPLVGVATLGATLGFLTMYALGVRLGAAVEDPARLRWIPKAAMRTARRWLQRWGYAVVAANRFLSGGRAAIALLVGASDLRLGPTALCAALSALVWTSLLAYAGYTVGANWARVLPLLQAYGKVISALIGLVVLVGVGRWWWRRRFAPVAPGSAPRNHEDPAG